MQQKNFRNVNFLDLIITINNNGNLIPKTNKTPLPLPPTYFCTPSWSIKECNIWKPLTILAAKYTC
jgi:hypothetical protein